MPFGLAGSIIGGGKQASAAKDAAGIQASAANHATDIAAQQYQQNRSDMAPWLQAGQANLSTLQGQLPGLTQGFDPSQHGVSPTFNYDPSTFESDPAFQSTMKYGQQAIERGAAARGGVLGGGTQRSLDQFGIDTANQFYNQDRSAALQTYQQNYQNAFNTFNSNQTNTFNRLASLANVGQTAGTQLGQAGQAYATTAGNNAMSAGNAGAAGVIGAANGAANAWGGATGSLSSMLSSGSNPFSSSYWSNMNPFGGGGASSSSPASSASSGSGSDDFFFG